MHLAPRSAGWNRSGRVFGVTCLRGRWRVAFPDHIRPPLPMILLLSPVSGKNERENGKRHVSFQLGIG